MADERPMVGQEIYGFYTGQPTVGVVLWDGTNASAAPLIADLVQFCNLRGAVVLDAHARASIMGGMSPRIELTIQYPDNGVVQDFTLQRYDALVLFSIHEKVVHIQVMGEMAARSLVRGGPDTIIISMDPGAPESPVVIAREIGDKLRILRGPLG